MDSVGGLPPAQEIVLHGGLFRTFGAGEAVQKTVIPLAEKEFLGWLPVCCRFAIRVTREVDTSEAPQCLALILPGVSCTESAEEPEKAPFCTPSTGTARALADGLGREAGGG